MKIVFVTVSGNRYTIQIGEKNIFCEERSRTEGEILRVSPIRAGEHVVIEYIGFDLYGRPYSDPMIVRTSKVEEILLVET